MRSSTVAERKSGESSRTRMPAARNGGHQLKSRRMPRAPKEKRERNPCDMDGFRSTRERRSWDALDQHRAALPAADAERRHAAPAAGALEHLEHVEQHARAGCADRVPQRDRSAVHVELRAIEAAEGMVEAEMLAAVLVALPRGEAAEHLRGERFVHLHGI